MRVISQDGTIDVPYDYFSLSVASGKYEDVEVAYIYCYNLSSPHGTKFAEYSSKEKALKAMEMLREAYREYIATVTTTQGITQTLIFVDNNEDNLKLSANIVKGIKENIYFQFPKDDEVEV